MKMRICAAMHATTYRQIYINIYALQISVCLCDYVCLNAFNCIATFIYRFVGHLGYGAAINAHNDTAIWLAAALTAHPSAACDFFVHFTISHFNFIVLCDCTHTRIHTYIHQPVHMCMCVYI